MIFNPLFIDSETKQINLLGVSKKAGESHLFQDIIRFEEQVANNREFDSGNILPSLLADINKIKNLVQYDNKIFKKNNKLYSESIASIENNKGNLTSFVKKNEGIEILNFNTADESEIHKLLQQLFSELNSGNKNSITCKGKDEGNTEAVNLNLNQLLHEIDKKLEIKNNVNLLLSGDEDDATLLLKIQIGKENGGKEQLLGNDLNSLQHTAGFTLKVYELKEGSPEVSSNDEYVFKGNGLDIFKKLSEYGKGGSEAEPIKNVTPKATDHTENIVAKPNSIHNNTNSGEAVVGTEKINLSPVTGETKAADSAQNKNETNPSKPLTSSELTPGKSSDIDQTNNLAKSGSNETAEIKPVTPNPETINSENKLSENADLNKVVKETGDRTGVKTTNNLDVVQNKPELNQNIKETSDKLFINNMNGPEINGNQEKINNLKTKSNQPSLNDEAALPDSKNDSADLKLLSKIRTGEIPVELKQPGTQGSELKIIYKNEIGIDGKNVAKEGNININDEIDFVIESKSSDNIKESGELLKLKPTNDNYKNALDKLNSAESLKHENEKTKFTANSSMHNEKPNEEKPNLSALREVAAGVNLKQNGEGKSKSVDTSSLKTEDKVENKTREITGDASKDSGNGIKEKGTGSGEHSVKKDLKPDQPANNFQQHMNQQLNTDNKVVKVNLDNINNPELSNKLSHEISELVISKSNDKAVLTLEPKNLGKIKVSVEIVENQLTAHVEVEKGAVKELLHHQVEFLRENLQNSGIILNSLNISLQNQESKNYKSQVKDKRKEKSVDEVRVDESGEENDTGKSLGYNTYEYIA